MKARFPKRAAITTLVLGLLCIGSLSLLAALPYSTSFVSSIPPQETEKAPAPRFSLGTLDWPVPHYAVLAALEPFRRLFRSHCKTLDGVAAASCVSNLMARSFPNGHPSTEFVDPVFDPARHLRNHLSGEAGHCMNRSAILATTLLASGVPARVVQVLSRDLLGHTLVEVWDKEGGWTMVDPTFGLVLSSDQGAPSAWALVSAGAAVRWRGAGARPEGGGDSLPISTWQGGTVLYPEPWLYLRAGTRQAPWPYRGRYVSLDPTPVVLGPGQRALGMLSAITGLAAACALAFTLVALARALCAEYRADESYAGTRPT